MLVQRANAPAPVPEATMVDDLQQRTAHMGMKFISNALSLIQLGLSPPADSPKALNAAFKVVGNGP